MVCLFLISVRRLFSICPEVENGYIKSIIAVNDEIWVGTMEAVLE